MQEDHRRALDELHEQRRGAESTLSRREEEMQLRIKTLEKELQVHFNPLLPPPTRTRTHVHTNCSAGACVSFLAVYQRVRNFEAIE